MLFKVVAQNSFSVHGDTHQYILPYFDNGKWVSMEHKQPNDRDLLGHHGQINGYQLLPAKFALDLVRENTDYIACVAEPIGETATEGNVVYCRHLNLLKRANPLDFMTSIHDDRLDVPYKIQLKDLPPQPGDLYVFLTDVDLAIEWLVVRYHIDDSNLVLLVPIDDAPFIGGADVVLNPLDTNHKVSLLARCGEAAWVEKTMCKVRVGTISKSALSMVRKRLAQLARGQIKSGPDELDPEYEDILTTIRQARSNLNI